MSTALQSYLVSNRYSSISELQVCALHKRKDLAVLKVVVSRRSIELGALIDIERREPFMTISTSVECNCRTYMFGFA